MSALDRLDAMVKAGVPYETALELARGFEAEREAEVKAQLDSLLDRLGQKPDAAAERKREADRLRMSARRAAEKAGREATSRDIARHRATPATSRDIGDAKDAPAPVHTRGEDNPSRLDTTGLVVVGGVGAREPDQQPDDWPEGNAKRHAELIVQTIGSPWLDPQKATTLVTTTGRIAAWKRAGASWEHDVLPVIQAACQGRRDRVNGWQYFDPAIARSIAENRAALEIPEAQARAPPRQSLTEQIADERRRAKELTLQSLASLKASHG